MESNVWRSLIMEKKIEFTDEELLKIAYALECRYGLSNELAEKIYQYFIDVDGKDYRL
jgi:hypothetical protein